jgi:hypothetical protein
VQSSDASGTIVSVEEHIATFPKVSSHFCRKDTSKLYLDSRLNVVKMHRLYIEWMKQEKPSAKVTTERQ